MTRMNWDRKRTPPDRQYAWPEKTPEQKALREAHASKRRTNRPGKRAHGPEIWIIVGANCPRNTTPGTRQIHCFKSRAEAQAAGFW